MKDLLDFIDTHFNELLLFVAMVLGGFLYWYRPETKDFVLGALVGAFIMSLKGRMLIRNNGNFNKGGDK